MRCARLLVRVKLIMANVRMWPQQSLLSRFLQKMHFRSARGYAMKQILLLTEIIQFYMAVGMQK